MNKLLENKIFAKQPFYTLSKPLNKLLQNKMLYHKNGNNESENKKYIVNPFKIQSRSTPYYYYYLLLPTTTTSTTTTT